jgi:cytochrome c
MKSVITGMFVAASLIVGGTALAADLPAANAKCGACHDVDKKKMGPSYKDISMKYKGDADAAGKIAASITKGGKFGWNTPMAMPPKGMGASDADIKAMAEYIAGLAK